MQLLQSLTSTLYSTNTAGVAMPAVSAIFQNFLQFFPQSWSGQFRNVQHGRRILRQPSGHRCLLHCVRDDYVLHTKLCFRVADVRLPGGLRCQERRCAGGPSALAFSHGATQHANIYVARCACRLDVRGC